MEAPTKKIFGIIDKKPRWGLSVRGWILLICMIAFLGAGIGFRIHPFLAVTEPNMKGYLVVEGWLPDYALREALEIFNRHDYQGILTTGVPLESGFHLSEYKDYAHLAKASLINIAADPNLSVTAISTPFVEKNRTYSTAVQVRNWFKEQGLQPTELDVITIGVHARRSRLLYHYVFGSDCKVGIWSVPDADYQPERWWAGSEGVKQTLTECFGYLYCRVFLNP